MSEPSVPLRLRRTAQRLGALSGALLALGGLVWVRTRPTPCPGAVTLEFHPPLAEPGSYRIQLSWPGAKPCELTVAVPVRSALPDGAKSGCGMALQLQTQVQGSHASLSGLVFAAAPERFHLQVKRNAEPVYDVELEPKYAPYPTRRADDPHFCGDRALLLPACLRGSSVCQPFSARCSGPQDCAAKEACCLTPEWGREYGPAAASECSSARSCLSHLGHLACLGDGDCPKDMRCGDRGLSADYTAAPLVCQSRARGTASPGADAAP